MVPVAAVTTTAIDRDGHDQRNDGCHDNEADDCSQYGSCLEHVAVPCRRRGGNIGAIHFSLVTFVCRILCE